ncbi:MAG: histidine kinase [Acidobacteria bacterium]|nr:histidine kinase [Acidobacteriota bacterium]MCB9399119.1 histidine kinase [Acidobacteriota bacterium]
MIHTQERDRLRTAPNFRTFIRNPRMWREILKTCFWGALFSPLVAMVLSGRVDDPLGYAQLWLEHPRLFAIIPAVGVVWASHITFASFFLRYFLVPKLPLHRQLLGFLSVAGSGFVMGMLTLFMIYFEIKVFLGMRVLDQTSILSQLVFSGIFGLVFALMFASFYEGEVQLRQADEMRTNLERHRLQAELMNLNMRIRPHFFFNALNTLSNLIDSDPEQAQGFLLELSDLFRLSFELGQKGPLCAWHEERRLLQQYLNLEQSRFGDRLQWTFEVDAPDTAPFPAFFLQPLFENAVHHGIGRIKSGGLIRFQARYEAGTWQFTLTNPQREGKPFAFHPGHALETIRDRIGLMNGSLSVDSTETEFQVQGCFFPEALTQGST